MQYVFTPLDCELNVARQTLTHHRKPVGLRRAAVGASPMIRQMVSVLLFIAGTVTAFTANIRAAHGDETDPYGILPIGLHYDFEIDAKTGETWKGLMPPVKDRYFLEPKTILIEPFHGEGDLIWTYVSTETRPIPEFLVRGSLLKEGPVDFVLKASFPYQQRFYQELNLPPEIGTPILEYTLLAEPNPPRRYLLVRTHFGRRPAETNVDVIR